MQVDQGCLHSLRTLAVVQELLIVRISLQSAAMAKQSKILTCPGRSQLNVTCFSMYSVLQPNQQGRARHILVLTDFKSKQHPSSMQLLAQSLLLYCVRRQHVH